MNRKVIIIIIAAMVVIPYLVYKHNQILKYQSNENMTVVKGQVVAFHGGKNDFQYAWVKYKYKGKTYESMTGTSVLDVYDIGDEIYISMDTLDPEKIKNIPDTFIAYNNFREEGKVLFYDTITAYHVNHESYNESIKFDLYIEGREYKLQKLTKLKPLRDSMMYIFVNGYFSEGFLKNYQ
jgi:hypothetical protein